jgi:hypothetical protein
MITGLMCIAAGTIMLIGLGGAWWIATGLPPGIEQDAIIRWLVPVSGGFGYFGLLSLFIGFGVISSRKSTQ